jgi:hypothetical protein
MGVKTTAAQVMIVNVFGVLDAAARVRSAPVASVVGIALGNSAPK